MAAAPLRAPGGEVIGTLAVSTVDAAHVRGRRSGPAPGPRRPGRHRADQLEPPRARSRARRPASAASSRHPDVLWRADADGIFTFMADTAETLFGWPIERDRRPALRVPDPPARCRSPGALRRDPAAIRTSIERVPLTLIRRDGTSLRGRGHDDRRLRGRRVVVGARARSATSRSGRVWSESCAIGGALSLPRPERAGRVWSIDGEARLTFLSDATERLTGFHPDELLGQHFGAFVHESSREVAEIDWTARWSRVRRRFAAGSTCCHRDGSAGPAEFIASPRSTRTASSPARTARSATCAIATASSASCAHRRTATGPSRRPRPTWSSRPTPRAGTRSSPTAPRRCSAGIWTQASVALVLRQGRARLGGGRRRELPSRAR